MTQPHQSALDDLATAAKLAYESRGWWPTNVRAMGVPRRVPWPTHTKEIDAIGDDAVVMTVTFPPGWTVPSHLGDVLKCAGDLQEIAHVDPRIADTIKAVQALWVTATRSTSEVALTMMLSSRELADRFGDLQATKSRRREEALRHRIQCLKRERALKTGYPG